MPNNPSCNTVCKPVGLGGSLRNESLEKVSLNNESFENSRLNDFILLFLGKRPPLDSYLYQEDFRPVEEGELLAIGQQTGNHWRKIINCFAKLAYELDGKSDLYGRWQDYRDREFLRYSSGYGISFLEPCVGISGVGFSGISLLAGKGYGSDWAKANDVHLTWLDADFAINREHRLIVTPYFDYRQLSNIKLTQLVSLIESLR